MRRLWAIVGGGAALAAASLWILSAPRPLAASQIATGPGDAAAGERMFLAGGCASCHSAEGAKDAERLRLGGGRRFVTDFGTFVAPNVSPDPETGIGGWSLRDFANAMQAGVSPEGRHYYPAFPYTSYVRMTPGDIADLWAWMQTLPPVSRPNEPHALGFPFHFRRGIGLWKRLNLDPAFAVDLSGAPEEVRRGQYLVEGPGHCAECHTPRDRTGGLERARWMAGAPVPAGKGRVPNITPHETGLGWSADEIADYLATGFTPDYDSVGGTMVEVVENTSRLPPEDRAAIAAYLRALPPVPRAP